MVPKDGLPQAAAVTNDCLLDLKPDVVSSRSYTTVLPHNRTLPTGIFLVVLSEFVSDFHS
jgi:hypothetical protein